MEFEDHNSNNNLPFHIPYKATRGAPCTMSIFQSFFDHSTKLHGATPDHPIKG